MRLREGSLITAQAVLFDMDGTLLNSIAAVERVWFRWAARHGLDASAILRVSHGCPTIETMRRFAPHLAVEEEASRFLDEELVETDGIVPVCGAVSLLRSLLSRRWGIVTSANRNLALVRLAAAGLPVPDVLITVDDVAQGKPDPEGYLTAARHLGHAPGDCLVIEDAPAGFAAGSAAGMRVIALATTYPPADIADQEWLPDLGALRLERDEPYLRLRVVEAA
jgi:sugar-phosphatase